MSFIPIYLPHPHLTSTAIGASPPVKFRTRGFGTALDFFSSSPRRAIVNLHTDATSTWKFISSPLALRETVPEVPDADYENVDPVWTLLRNLLREHINRSERHDVANRDIHTLGRAGSFRRELPPRASAASFSAAARPFSTLREVITTLVLFGAPGLENANRGVVADARGTAGDQNRGGALFY